MRKWMLLAALLVVAALLVSACAQRQPAGEAPPPAPQVTDDIGVLKIGPGEPVRLAYALVVAGPDETLGIDSRRGIEVAIDDMGGKLLGHPIELVGEDEGCNPEGGQAAALKLAADSRIVAVIGTNCSSAARAGVPTLSKAGFTIISPSNTAPFLTAPDRGPDFDGYFRTAHNDKVQGAVAAQFAYKFLGLRRAATIHDGSPYAESLQQVFADEFRRLGGTVTNQEAVGPEDTEMRPVLTRIAANKPEIIYYPIFIAAGANITSQARTVSGLENTVLMGADGMFSPDFVDAAGSAAEGMYLSSPDFEAFGAAYSDFLAKHQKKYGEKPLSAFHAHAYDAAMIIFKAIEKVAVQGPDGTLYIGRKALRDAVAATGNHAGLTGNLNCDPYGDCSDPKIAVYQVKVGEWPPKKVWSPE